MYWGIRRRMRWCVCTCTVHTLFTHISPTVTYSSNGSVFELWVKSLLTMCEPCVNCVWTICEIWVNHLQTVCGKCMSLICMTVCVLHVWNVCKPCVNYVHTVRNLFCELCMNCMWCVCELQMNWQATVHVSSVYCVWTVRVLYVNCALTVHELCKYCG